MDVDVEGLCPDALDVYRTAGIKFRQPFLVGPSRLELLPGCVNSICRSRSYEFHPGVKVFCIPCKVVDVGDWYPLQVVNF